MEWKIASAMAMLLTNRSMRPAGAQYRQAMIEQAAKTGATHIMLNTKKRDHSPTVTKLPVCSDCGNAGNAMTKVSMVNNSSENPRNERATNLR